MKDFEKIFAKCSKRNKFEEFLKILRRFWVNFVQNL